MSERQDQRSLQSVVPFQVIEQVDEPRAEKPRDKRQQDQDLFVWTTAGVSSKAGPTTDLGRQQAYPLIAEERPNARGDREAGRDQADLDRPAF